MRKHSYKLTYAIEFRFGSPNFFYSFVCSFYVALHVCANRWRKNEKALNTLRMRIHDPIQRIGKNAGFTKLLCHQQQHLILSWINKLCVAIHDHMYKARSTNDGILISTLRGQKTCESTSFIYFFPIHTIEPLLTFFIPEALNILCTTRCNESNENLCLFMHHAPTTTRSSK